MVVSTDVEVVELSDVVDVDVELLVELEEVVSEVAVVVVVSVEVVVLTQEASETGVVVVDADVEVVVETQVSLVVSDELSSLETVDVSSLAVEFEVV